MNHNVQMATFIATLGTEPQVVTAALDLLHEKGETIKKVIVLHTTTSSTLIDQAVQTLQTASLIYQQKGITWNMNPLTGPDDELLTDVETPSASRSAFRILYATIQKAKKRGQKVHLSIAGGRKTMAVFGMVAAQLLFDQQDQLWHLYSGGEFLDSKRLHPRPGDDVHLIPIPVVQWSKVAPMLLDFADIDDPFKALERQADLRMTERLEDMRAFVKGSLTPAEERVVAILVKQGLSNHDIAAKLHLSPRTVEEHLRSAYSKAADQWDLTNVSRTHLISLLNLYYSTQITGNPG